MAVNQSRRQFSDDELAHRFEYHPPRSESRRRAHEHVRSQLADAAAYLNELVPDGREKALVVTHLEEAMFWANAALARSDDPEATEPV